jgi:hypothetical protein
MAGRQMGSASVRRRSGRGGLRGCDCCVSDLPASRTSAAHPLTPDVTHIFATPRPVHVARIELRAYRHRSVSGFGRIRSMATQQIRAAAPKVSSLDSAA